MNSCQLLGGGHSLTHTHSLSLSLSRGYVLALLTILRVTECDRNRIQRQRQGALPVADDSVHACSCRHSHAVSPIEGTHTSTAQLPVRDLVATQARAARYRPHSRQPALADTRALSGATALQTRHFRAPFDSALSAQISECRVQSTVRGVRARGRERGQTDRQKLECDLSKACQPSITSSSPARQARATQLRLGSG